MLEPIVSGGGLGGVGGVWVAHGAAFREKARARVPCTRSPAKLRERGEAELKEALRNAGQLFTRLQAEMEESGIHTYRPGPWHAGLAPFPQA